MIVELRGVEFVNKGAELMLLAILYKLRSRYSKVKIVMQVTNRVPAEKLREHKIFIKIRPSTNTTKRIIKGLIPDIAYQMFGYVKEESIDIVLDASGFAFGDQWGASYAENRLGKHIVQWKRTGKRIVLLPQAFGSFNDEGTKMVMLKIITNADLVFAREGQSYDYLKNIIEADHIKIAPDFTNLISGKVIELRHNKPNVAIIPNYKMLEKTNLDRHSYCEFLCNAINRVKRNNLTPFFLIHEGQKDRTIAKEASRLLDVEIPIVCEQDPLVIKGIIGNSKFIICSRFHGIVSALSQGVPVIAAGWSHKYRLLMADYGQTDFLLNDLSSHQQVYSLIDRLSDRQTREILCREITAYAKKQKELSEKMWDTVFNVIEV